MSAKMIVGNLPAGTGAEEIRQELSDIGAPVLHVDQVAEGDPDKLAFVVELDMDPRHARLMAERRHERFFKGRKLSVYVPGMMS